MDILKEPPKFVKIHVSLELQIWGKSMKEPHAIFTLSTPSGYLGFYMYGESSKIPDKEYLNLTEYHGPFEYENMAINAVINFLNVKSGFDENRFRGFRVRKLKDLGYEYQ